MRNTAKITLALCGVSVLVIYAASQYIVPSVCENTVIESQPSPDGIWKVVLFERSCGATTGFSSQVSLLQAQQDLPSNGGNIYVAEGYPEGFTLTWNSIESVTIRGPQNKHYLKAPELNGITFHYELLTP